MDKLAYHYNKKKLPAKTENIFNYFLQQQRQRDKTAE